MIELVLKSDNEQSLAKIIALAEQLNVLVEKNDVLVKSDDRSIY